MTQPRGIDHLVLAVDDLDAAAAHYRLLGFQVGARNRHPWGTENHIVQFPGAFLELLALGGELRAAPPADDDASAPQFLRFVRRFLAERGQGFAMLVLESQDALADKADFDAAGIGGFEPFFFERFGERPDGSRVRVAFTLAFAASGAMPDIGCFVSQQHEPHNFWNTAFQVHDNGATGIGGVVMVADDARDPLSFLQAVSGAQPVCVGARNIAIVTPRGSIEAMTPPCFADVLGVDPVSLPSPQLAAFKVFAPLAPMRERLEAGGIPFLAHRKHLVVAAAGNLGAALVFEEPRAR